MSSPCLVTTALLLAHHPALGIDILQAQQRRLLQLEGELEAMRVEAERQQEALAAQKAKTRAAEGRIQDMQQELDNNAGALEDSAQFTHSARC